MFVIAANPDLVATSTQSIKGTWGTGTVQRAVKKAFKKTAKEAETSQDIKFKATSNALK